VRLESDRTICDSRDLSGVDRAVRTRRAQNRSDVV